MRPYLQRKCLVYDRGYTLALNLILIFKRDLLVVKKLYEEGLLAI
jgi:hypothetical protein